jgi:hypothetical protein
MNHAVVEILYAAEMVIEFALQSACAGQAGRWHLARQQIKLVFTLRQGVRLTIFVKLEPVFQMTHELVR